MSDNVPHAVWRNAAGAWVPVAELDDAALILALQWASRNVTRTRSQYVGRAAQLEVERRGLTVTGGVYANRCTWCAKKPLYFGGQYSACSEHKQHLVDGLRRKQLQCDSFRNRVDEKLDARDRAQRRHDQARHCAKFRRGGRRA